MRALAFDVFGTLLDPSGIVAALRPVARDPEGFAADWRATQLEYAFLLAATDRYLPFGEVTRRALRRTAEGRGLSLPEEAEAALGDAWTRLPAFPDVPGALPRLAERIPLAVLSNGDPPVLEAALEHAGIRAAFPTVLSAAEARALKPSRKVYALAVDRLGLPPGEIALVSSNAFDVLGGRAAGLRGIWVNRTGASFDDLGLGPDLEVRSLAGLTAERLAALR